MERKSQNTNNASQIRDYLVIIIIAVVGAAIALGVFFKLYNVSRQSILNMYSAKTITMSQKIEYYLNVPKDAILITSESVENMIARGNSNQEINEFLISGTEVFADVVVDNTTGIYGYINGEYLDSSGWTPPKYYRSFDRPWYIEAVEADGEVAFVEPYLNVQTNTLMMSVSKLLSDKKSVISMDIYLDGLQRLEKEMLEEKYLEAAMIVDSSGIVVAHSNEKEIGSNYLLDSEKIHKSILEGAFSHDENAFTVVDRGIKKLVFSRKITDEWYSLYIFNENKLFGSVAYIFIHSIVVLVIVFIGFLAAFNLVKRRHKETRQLQNELAAIADIYLSLSILDLKGLKLNKMWVSPRLTQILSSGHYSLDRVDEIVRVIAAESSRNMLEQFMDFSTVPERLKNSRSISHDFIDIDNHWTRMHFIAGDRDKNGKLLNVIWATESIDEDKRRQELLRQKAETDSLTKILNRNGGEVRMADAIERGKKGMLMILDADHFKHVNDSFGHDVGDKVIIGIAQCLTKTFRDSDIVFRLGGDEFCVFASGVDNRNIGGRVAERLFRNVDSFDLPELTDWKLCVSIGATFCDPDKGLSFDQLYKQADIAMYDSKQHEGNFISFYE